LIFLSSFNYGLAAHDFTLYYSNPYWQDLVIGLNANPDGLGYQDKIKDPANPDIFFKSRCANKKQTLKPVDASIGTFFNFLKHLQLHVPKIILVD